MHNIALTGVEGHAPPDRPSVQTVKVMLQYSLVPRIVDGYVNKTVVGEEADMGALRDVAWHVIDIDEKKQWPEDCSLGDARENLRRSRPLTIHSDAHASACQEGLNPGVHGSLDTVVSQLAEETLMRHLHGNDSLQLMVLTN